MTTCCRRSPRTSAGLGPAATRWSTFFDSLDKVAALGPDVTVVLPAHGHPFSDLAGRAKAIREHHLARLELVRTASHDAGHPLSVQEVSTVLFSPRAQGPMADSETFAHLEHLRLAGEYRARADTARGYRYTPIGDGANFLCITAALRDSTGVWTRRSSHTAS